MSLCITSKCDDATLRWSWPYHHTNQKSPPRSSSAQWSAPRSSMTEKWSPISHLLVLPETFGSELLFFYVCTHNSNNAMVSALKTKREDSRCYTVHHWSKTSKTDTAEPILATVSSLHLSWGVATLNCQSREWLTELPANSGLNYEYPQIMPFFGFPFHNPLAICWSEEEKGRDKREEMFTRFKYPIPSRWESWWSLWTINSRNGYLKGAFQVALWQRISLPCRRHKRDRFDFWVGKIPWRRHGYPLQYSCLENPMDRGAGGATVHKVTNGY